ncbi:MAG: hypothetical protein KC964_19480 [Candidatus Omnitrophica bacterium]|nr:hypothetical protein [Candidatus Omnitrophota bacterium]
MGTPFSSAPGHHTSASPFAFLPAGKALAVSLILSLMLSLAGTYLLAAMQKQEATSGELSVIPKREPEISSQATIRILCYPWAEITLTQKGSKRTYRFQAPMRDAVAIPSGPYEMRGFKNDNLKFSRNLYLHPGQSCEVQIRLDRNTIKIFDPEEVK